MPTIRRTFRSLSTRNYRLFYVGQLVSLSGTACQIVALSWVVYRLSDSAIALGTVTGLSLLPMLLAGAWGGLIADRFDKRQVLILANAALAVVATLLAAVTLLGAVHLWQLYLLAFLSGLGSAVEIPTRQAFVNELVEPGQLPNAIGLNSALFNASRIVGPAVAAALLALVGGGWCFAVNALSFLAVIEAYRRMRPTELRRAPRQGAERGQVRAGLRYAWGEPVLRRTIGLVGLVALFAFNFPIILPVLAERTYGGGSAMFSALTATMALGSVVGALVIAGRRRPTDRTLLVTGLASGLLLVATASTTTLWLVLPLFALSGGAGIAFFSTANARVQLVAAGQMRGRVMALYSLVFLGTTPVAAPLIGWIVQRFGPQAALGGGGLLSTISVAAVLAPTVRADRRPSVAAPSEPLPEPGSEAIPVAAWTRRHRTHVRLRGRRLATLRRVVAALARSFVDPSGDDGEGARRAASVRALAERVAPTALARDRTLPVLSALTGLVGAGLRRGATVTVAGEAGLGATSLAFAMVAAATQAGSWAAVVGAPAAHAPAAAHLGVALERLALVPDAATLGHWPTVVAALLDGVDLVVAAVPAGLRAPDARRLVARARERGSVLVPLVPPGASWVEGADVRLRVTGATWHGLDQGHGFLQAREVEVAATGRGAAGRERSLRLWLPGHDGVAVVEPLPSGVPTSAAPSPQKWAEATVDPLGVPASASSRGQRWADPMAVGGR